MSMSVMENHLVPNAIVAEDNRLSKEVMYFALRVKHSKQSGSPRER